ncbi:hypothetical protein ACVIGV_001529 [Rhizobium leguminosarum]
MDAGLGGEGGSADIGHLVVGRAVEQLVEGMREPGEVKQPLLVDRRFETCVVGALQRQRRDQRHQIGIAAALADAVQRALDLPDTGFDGGKRIGDRLAGVVMRMDAKTVPGNARGDHRLDDRPHLRRLRTAIGVAEHHPAGAALIGRLGAGERIGRVGLEAVEEMLAIDDRLLARANRRLDTFGDAFEVFLVGAAKRHRDVIIPALGDETDGIAFGLKQPGNAGIVGDRNARPLRHAKGDEAGLAGALLTEEGRIRRIGAGISALDVVEAELVQHGRDRNLVLDGEIDAGRLLPVPERRVEEVDAFFHVVSSRQAGVVFCCAEAPSSALRAPSPRGEKG